MEKQKYTALLRGINVGGHHKVPMAELRKILEDMGFAGVKTLLNSGNIVFAGTAEETETLEERIAVQLEKSFGFPVPVLIRRSDEIHAIIAADPFKTIEVHKDIRLYITFLKESPLEIPDFPRVSLDGSFQIIEVKDKEIYSVLDVSKINTPDAMNVLEKTFSKDITTRNWNTLVKVDGLLS